MEPVQVEPQEEKLEITVSSFPFVTSKHEFNPEVGTEGSESGEGEGGEGSSEGGSNG